MNTPTDPSLYPNQGGDSQSNFGNILMQMLQQYQGINKTPFLAGQLNAQSQAAQSVAYNDPALVGASPSQQEQARSANTAPLNTLATGLGNAQTTFSGQLQQFESILNQANQFGKDFITMNPGPQVVQGYVDGLRTGAMNFNQIPAQALPSVMKAISQDPTIVEDYKNAQIPKPVKIGTDDIGNPIYAYPIWNPSTNSYSLTVPQVPGSTNPTGTPTQTSNQIIKSPSGNSYDLQGYATDPTKVTQVQSILDKIGKLRTPQDISNYLSKFPGTPITADMITSASQKYGVGWEELLAQMQQESQMGTAGAATGVLGKNNFAAVGNTGTHTNSYDTPQGGVNAAAEALAGRKLQSETNSGVPTLQEAQQKAQGTPLKNASMEQAAYDLAFGNTPPPTSTIPRSAKTAQYQNQITQRAEQLNPNFKLSAAAGQYKYATDTSTKTKVQAINAVLPNMDMLIELSDAFQRSDYPTINSALRTFGWLTGNQTVSSLNEAAAIIGDEMGVALGGGTMSDMKLQLGLKTVDPILSVDNYSKNIKLVKTFLNNRLQSIAQQAGPYAQSQLGITPDDKPQTMEANGKTYVLNHSDGLYYPQ